MVLFLNFHLQAWHLPFLNRCKVNKSQPRNTYELNKHKWIELSESWSAPHSIFSHFLEGVASIIVRVAHKIPILSSFPCFPDSECCLSRWSHIPLWLNSNQDAVGTDQTGMHMWLLLVGVSLVNFLVQKIFECSCVPSKRRLLGTCIAKLLLSCFALRLCA